MSDGCPDKILGAQVRLARELRKLSLRTLAGLLGVSPATLSHVENGKTRLSAVRLSRIADILDFEVHEILELEASPHDRMDASTELRRHPRHDGVELGETSFDWRVYEPLTFDPVLSAALGEFLDIGYHGASVRGIAARCDMSVSGIYHYYSSKQEMLRAVLDYAMGELLRRSECARAEGQDSVARFLLLVENLVLFHTHRRELGFVGAGEMRSLDADNRRAVADKRNLQQRMIDEEVARSVSDGFFRPDSPLDASRAVVTMCTALPSWWRPDGPLSPSRLADMYTTIALDVMRYRSPDRPAPTRPALDRP
ncbi:AcrR family transcriptional regulator/DNA-binding Xre family transcriptional regulator [Rhodococcus sp. 27YEA15]|uniref:helix-turn-helix domain-containing protein n=1 Tax=Rhodococcus sp. 27YEA15 TaxID=3156259 RepID=UPI003C7E3F58